ncbi:UNVERIFIED_CONTAM: ATP synthase gamma chain, chloroplastic [Sesamum latifolium]|uniref:F-ATPase gamma subunit n=1 Tax=Sesamum latifolium TaxID=2727402 RepID=A0AAW2TPR3_9LAMI
MSCFNLLTGMISKPSVNDFGAISFQSQLKPFPNLDSLRSSRSRRSKFSTLPSIRNGLRELRGRIETVKNTQKITEAMKLVAAAKVRRAQEAVINGRPFAETLVEVLFDINEQCQLEDVEVPLTAIRPVKRVALVVITGDRGLCGGFNYAILKKAEARIAELKSLGLDCTLISVGKKGNAYLQRRANVNVEGEACDVNGESVDASEDEFFRLTTKEGKLTVERDHIVGRKKANLLLNYQFEQDPAQILDALMPLYLNSQILRALQESYASELAARMNAMSNATENAVELNRSLSIAYNRERQAKITGEILEIVAGAEALSCCSMPPVIKPMSHLYFLVSITSGWWMSRRSVLEQTVVVVIP